MNPSQKRLEVYWAAMGCKLAKYGVDGHHDLYKGEFDYVPMGLSHHPCGKCLKGYERATKR